MQTSSLEQPTILVIDTESDEKGEYLREIAWCIYRGANTLVDWYSSEVRNLPASRLPDDGSAPTSVEQMGIPSFECLPASALAIGNDPMAVRKEKALSELAASVAKHRPDFLVGHNLEYDIRVVAAQQHRGVNKSGILTIPRICTMLATWSPGRKFKTLAALHTECFGVPHESAHHALSDAKATAACFWRLYQAGLLSGYNHQANLSESRKSAEQRLHEVEVRMQKHARRECARDAAIMAHKEKAEARSRWWGGVDVEVLARVRRFAPHEFEKFKETYSHIFSQREGAYIARKLRDFESIGSLKPDTAWKCVKAYARVASEIKRSELATIYCDKRGRHSLYLRLELGDDVSRHKKQLENWIQVPEDVSRELSDLVAGSTALMDQLLIEQGRKFENHVKACFALLDWCQAGDKRAIGYRHAQLPWVAVVFDVRQRPVLKRLFGWLC